MPATAAQSMQRAIGRSPESLSLEDRALLVGKFIALEIYSPDTLPLRRIEAIGENTGECVRMLQSRGLDPTNFEYSQLHPAMY
jgi:hypothetical protein